MAYSTTLDMNNQVDAVFFDLDGTILDTVGDLADSANAVLGSLGYPTHPEDAYNFFLGNGVRNLYENCLPAEAVSDDVLDECVRRMKEVYSERWNQRTKPFPHITELLDFLTANQIPLVTLSNKPDPFTVKIIEHFFGHYTWATVRGALPDVPLKPDPSSALAICEEHGYSPERVWYLGDTSTDMKTAVAAEFKAVGVSWGFRAREELIEHGAEWVIDDPLELIELL